MRRGEKLRVQPAERYHRFKVRKMEERRTSGGRYRPDEEERLPEAIRNQTSPNRSQMLGTFVRMTLLTGMRSGKITTLTWGQVDVGRRVLTVGKAKTASGTGRQIPMNADLLGVLSLHAQWFT